MEAGTGTKMSNTEIHQRLYQELIQWCAEHGIKPILIKLLGYSLGNLDYGRAKAPLSKGWTASEHSLSGNEINAHLHRGGWIGLLVPPGFIVVDVDNRDYYRRLHSRLKDLDIRHIAITTPGGGQFIFRDTNSVKTQGTKMITLGGVLVDYRLAGKGQIVMPTENTEGRYVNHMDHEIDALPLFFLPLRRYNEDKDIDAILPIPIRKGHRDDTLFRHACRLREWNAMYVLRLSHHQMVQVLREVNWFLCEPPLDEGTVEVKVKSALSYPTASNGPGQKTSDPGYLCRCNQEGDDDLSGGWVKLYRKLLDNSVFKDSEAVHLLVYSLLKANHKEKKILWNGNEITVKRGQFITGLHKISKETGISVKKIRARKKLFERLGIWAIKTAHTHSMLSVCNYGKYQGNQSEEGHTRGHSQGTYRATNKNEKKNTLIEDSIEFELASLLFSEIQKKEKELKLSPTKEPNLQEWTQHIDRLIRIDGRTPERIRDVIEWCQHDPFWQHNIDSTRKLREKFKKMEGLMVSKRNEKAAERPKEVREDLTGSGVREVSL
jgi:hypothetical protein